MRFSKTSVGGQAAIDSIELGIVIVIALICVTVVELGSDSPTSGTEKGSVEFEQTQPAFDQMVIDSDSVKTDEAQEQADNDQADSAKSQAAERQNNAYWQ